MKYKGYFGTVEYDKEEKTWFGSIVFIKDTVIYDGDDMETLKQHFEESVDDYLIFQSLLDGLNNET